VKLQKLTKKDEKNFPTITSVLETGFASNGYIVLEESSSGICFALKLMEIIIENIRINVYPISFKYLEVSETPKELFEKKNSIRPISSKKNT